MPLKRRLPKVGFTSPNPRVYSEVNIGRLNDLPEGTEVTPELLKEKRFIRSLKNSGVKILGRGTLDTKLTVKAHKFSVGARKAIEEAGGTCEEIK